MEATTAAASVLVVVLDIEPEKDLSTARAKETDTWTETAVSGDALLFLFSSHFSRLSKVSETVTTDCNKSRAT